jgi:hypothetical protein
VTFETIKAVLRQPQQRAVVEDMNTIKPADHTHRRSRTGAMLAGGAVLIGVWLGLTAPSVSPVNPGTSPAAPQPAVVPPADAGPRPWR